MTAPQQTSQQRLPLFDRSPYCASFRIVVLGNHGLIALIDLPVNVTLVMIPNQYLPVLATALHLSTDPLLPALKSE